MSKKVAIVTGAAGDIGSKVVAGLTADGIHVFAVDRDEARVNVLARAMQDLHGTACVTPHVADVTRSDEVSAFAARAFEINQGVDYFFNNAGIAGRPSPIQDYPDDEFDAVMTVNVKGVFLGLKHVLPRMRDGGAIVNTASTAGLVAAPNLAPYAASKAAVLGLTRSVAVEAATRAVRINAVCPGFVDSRMTERLETEIFGKPGHDPFLGMIPMGRFAQPTEIAEMVLFLLSPRSVYCTGGVFTVDGGYTAA